MSAKSGPVVFTLDDIHRIKKVHHHSVAPDGHFLAYVTTCSVKVGSERRDEIVLLDLKTNKQEVITSGTQPSWSPDGQKIAFTTAEYGEKELWLYDLDSKEKRFLVKIHHSDYFMGHLAVKNFSWSPDGKYIAYVGADPVEDTEQTDGGNVRIFNRLLYKTTGGRIRPVYSDSRQTHIWIVPVAEDEPKMLTTGSFNEHSLDWSPDGEQLVYVSDRSEDPDYTYRNDLWIVDRATKRVKRLTATLTPAFQPQWSPDGKLIAFLSVRKQLNSKDSPSEDLQIYLYSLETKEIQCLNRELDRRVEFYSWAEDGKSLYMTYGNAGTTCSARLDISSGKIHHILGDKNHILEYSIVPENMIIYAATNITTPGELYLYNSESKESLSLTQANQFLTFDRQLCDAETFWFDSFDGTPVQGWIMKPTNFTSDREYPLILVIHGGPHNMFGYDFEIRMQTLAGAGYGVVYMNPRGSTGYGQAFTNGTLMNWGGEDYQDLMAGMDFVTSQYDWVDEDRLGVTGQSYGGYMTNWIITQTNRFQAAVSDGGISNLISFAGTSLYHLLMEAEFNGKPWENYPVLWQWSPLRGVGNVSTPTLFLHGESDNEVPFSQSEEMYVALKKRRVDTELVQYLGEGHGWQPDLSPQNRYDLYLRTIHWFDRYV